MKVSIHINHDPNENLDQIQAVASALGFASLSRGEFMGRRHIELEREMDASTLRQLIEAGMEGRV